MRLAAPTGNALQAGGGGLGQGEAGSIDASRQSIDLSPNKGRVDLDTWHKLNARFHFLEVALWLAFAYFVVEAANGYGSDEVALAGVIALAAIGVRATRAEAGAAVPAGDEPRE